jgi:hypothetical protein
MAAETVAFNPKLDDLGLRTDPKALSEGFADYFASTLTGEPNFGSYNDGLMGEPLRRLEDPPGEHATCPASLSGEIHADSIIWSRALWDVRKALGAEKADRYAYATLQGVNAQASLSEAAQLLLTVVQHQGSNSEADQVQTILADRGLLSCKRIIPLPTDKVISGNLYSRSYFIMGNGPVPHSIQYRLDIPASAKKVSLKLVPHLTIQPEVWLLIKRRQPVGIHLEKNTVATQLFDSDDAFVIQSGSETTIDLKIGAEGHSIKAGETYYLLLANNGPADLNYDLLYRINDADQEAASSSDNSSLSSSTKGDQPSERATSNLSDSNNEIAMGCSYGASSGNDNAYNNFISWSVFLFMAIPILIRRWMSLMNSQKDRMR